MSYTSQQSQQVQYMTPSQQASLLQEQQSSLTKLQNDLAFLVNLLKQAKSDRDIHLAEIASLKETIIEKDKIINDIDSKRKLEEYSFKMLLKKERDTYDKHLFQQNQVMKEYENIVHDWINVGVNLACHIPSNDKKLHEILEKTCDNLPKYKDITLDAFRKLLIDSNTTISDTSQLIRKISSKSKKNKGNSEISTEESSTAVLDSPTKNNSLLSKGMEEALNKALKKN